MIELRSDQLKVSVIVVHSLCCIWLWDSMECSTEFANSQSLLTVMSIELVMLSNHLIFCCPLLVLPSIFPSIRVFSSELALCIRWPKHWNFNFSVSPSNEYSGLVYLSRFQKASWRRWHPVNILRENMSSPVKQMWSIPGRRNSTCKSLEERNSSPLCVV